MKKVRIGLALTMLLMVNVVAMAQLRFGVKGGLNMHKMSMNTNIFKSDDRIGYFMGPTLQFNSLVDRLGMDVSALYDYREYHFTSTTSAPTVIAYKQQQLLIPVHVRYTFGLKDHLNIFGFAGPQVGFTIYPDGKNIVDQVAEWTLPSTNFSVDMGVGITIATHYQLSATYNVAIGKTSDITLKNIEKSIRYKTNETSWQIAFAYLF